MFNYFKDLKFNKNNWNLKINLFNLVVSTKKRKKVTSLY